MCVCVCVEYTSNMEHVLIMNAFKVFHIALAEKMSVQKTIHEILINKRVLTHIVDLKHFL